MTATTHPPAQFGVLVFAIALCLLALYVTRRVRSRRAGDMSLYDLRDKLENCNTTYSWEITTDSTIIGTSLTGPTVVLHISEYDSRAFFVAHNLQTDAMYGSNSPFDAIAQVLP